MPTWIIAILPMVGVLLGATLQYWFSKTSERHKHYQALRTQAYIDFIRGVSNLAIAQRSNDKSKQIESLSSLTDAKIRIVIYGSKSVVNKLANFYRNGAILDNPESRNNFLNMCQAMRLEGFSKNQIVIDNDISQILFEQDE